MEKWIKWFKLKFGPLQIVQPNYFTDSVSGTTVNLYKDASGKYWMATNKWGFDKCPSTWQER